MSTEEKTPIAIGWVPNVIGTLSYNILNKNGTNVELADYISHHASDISKNSSGRDEQVIHTAICDVNDQDPSNKGDKSKYIRLIIYGEKNTETKEFEGQIWEIKLVTAKEEDKKDELKGTTSDYHINILNALKKITNKETDSSRYPSPITENFKKEILKKILIKKSETEGLDEAFVADTAEFKLQRDGLFYIYPIQRYLVNEKGYEGQNITKKLKEQDQISEEFAIRIKQLFHSHHHHRSTDDFLSCVNYDQNLHKPFLKIIRNLKHSISHERRKFLSEGFTEKDASNLIGLSAYGKSLTKICEQNLSKSFSEKEKRARYSRSLEQKKKIQVQEISQHADFFDSLKTSVNAHRQGNSNFIFNFLGNPPLYLFTLNRLIAILLPFLVFIFTLSKLLNINFFEEEALAVYVKQISLAHIIVLIILLDMYSYFIKFKQRNATLSYQVWSIPVRILLFIINLIPLPRITNSNNIRTLFTRRLFIIKEFFAKYYRYKNPHKKAWYKETWLIYASISLSMIIGAVIYYYWGGNIFLIANL